MKLELIKLRSCVNNSILDLVPTSGSDVDVTDIRWSHCSGASTDKYLMLVALLEGAYMYPVLPVTSHYQPYSRAIALPGLYIDKLIECVCVC